MLKRLFDDCVFEAIFDDRDKIEREGGVFNGDASIAAVTGQKFTRVLSLDGTGDYVDFGNQEVANFGTGDFSVEVVFLADSGTGNDLVSKRSGINNAIGFNLGVTGADNLFFELDDGAGNEINFDSTDVVDGLYHHVVISCDRNSNGILYLDGSSIQTKGISTVGNINSTVSLMVGENGNTSRPFDGNIALVRLWKRVLTADEVSLLATTHGF